MSEKIEKLFKNALEQVSVEPPARVWEGINSHFVMKQRRLRRIYTYSGIAAAVILLFGMGFFMQSKHTNIYTPTSVATLNSNINNQDNNKILAFTSTPHSIPEIKRKRVTRQRERGETYERSNQKHGTQREPERGTE